MMTKHLRGIRYLIAAAPLLLAACFDTTDNEQVRLKLNWTDGVDFLGFYIADERGYYADEKLKVSIEPLIRSREEGDVFEKVAQGEYDFSLAGLSLVRAQTSGKRLTALANIVKLAPGAFFARKSTGISGPADLAGHTVVVKSDTWRVLLEDFLRQGGLTLDDVDVFEGGFDMAPFLEGKVDVWAGFINDEVVRARHQGVDIITLPLYEYGARGGAGTIYARESMLRENPALAERFVRASLRGWRWALANPLEAIEIMVKRFPDLAEDREFLLASFNATIPLIRPPGTALGSIDCQAWRGDANFRALTDNEWTCTTTVFEVATGGS